MSMRRCLFSFASHIRMSSAAASGAHDHFTAEYPVVRQKILSSLERFAPNASDIASYVTNMLDYNLMGGKTNRGRMVVDCYQLLNPSCSSKQLSQACSVGWSLEMMQSAFLVADDMMDRSDTRRNKLCWYRVPSVGLQAINDAMFLAFAIDSLISETLSDHSSLNAVVTLMNQSKYLTCLGQYLDMETSKRPIELSTWERYHKIVALKTSHYSFCLPLLLAYELASLNTKEMTEEIKQLSDLMGSYFQAQDDFLDHFGDPKVTGKVGTDVRDGKCTWLLATTLQLCPEGSDDRQTLKDHYGLDSDTSVEAIRQLYDRLALERQFRSYELSEFSRVTKAIEESRLTPVKSALITLIQQLHHRSF